MMPRLSEALRALNDETERLARSTRAFLIVFYVALAAMLAVVVVALARAL